MTIALTNAQLAEVLSDSGWLKPGGRSEPFSPSQLEIETALAEYQEWWGLDQTGRADDATTQQLLLPRICALPDRMELFGRGNRNQICRWEKTRLRWNLTGTSPGISFEDFRRGLEIAWEMWEKVCGIIAEYIEDSRAADVVMNVGRIDGPGGTLAWSELPCGTDRQRKQLYGSNEPWSVSVNPPSRYIGLPTVGAHEIGHVLGLEHTPTARQLMNPTYNPAVNRPQSAWDIPQVVGRYGAPTARPPKPPEPPVEPPIEPPDIPPPAGLLPISIDLSQGIIVWGQRQGDIVWRN